MTSEEQRQQRILVQQETSAGVRMTAHTAVPVPAQPAYNQQQNISTNTSITSFGRHPTAGCPFLFAFLENQ